jgi:hypothetical protein
MTEIGCGLAAKTAHMTDAEFWEFVFHRHDVRDDDLDPDLDDAPVLTTCDCYRCGVGIEVGDWQEACDRVDDALCDECADALLPDVEVTR